MNKSLFLIPIIVTTLLSGCFVGIHGTAVAVAVAPPIIGDTEAVVVGLSEAAKAVHTDINTRDGNIFGGNWIANKVITIQHVASTIVFEPVVRNMRFYFYETSFHGDDTDSRTTIDWIKDEGLKFNGFRFIDSGLSLTLNLDDNTYDSAPFWDWAHYKGFTTTEDVDSMGTTGKLTAIYYTTFQAREKLTEDKTLATGTERVCLHTAIYPDLIDVDYTCINAGEDVTLLNLDTRKSHWNEFFTIFKVNGADGALDTNPYENGVYVCRNFVEGAGTLASDSPNRLCHIDSNFVLDKDDWFFVDSNENYFRDPDGGTGSTGHGNRFYGGSPLDWLSAAVWLFIPEDETDTSGYTVGAFADGRNPSYGGAVTPLTGTATYSGKSSGIFFDETATTFTNGKFDADFALTADFGSTSAEGRVSGVISNIKKTTKGASVGINYRGKIIFANPPGTGQNVIDTDKAIFNGEALRDTSTTSIQTEHAFTGSYRGGFFHGRYTDDGVTLVTVIRGAVGIDSTNTVTPNLVTGTFTVTGAGASTSDISTLVGIFHGQKDLPTP